MQLQKSKDKLTTEGMYLIPRTANHRCPGASGVGWPEVCKAAPSYPLPMEVEWDCRHCHILVLWQDFQSQN